VEKMTPKIIVALIVRLFAIGLLVFLVRVLFAEFLGLMRADEYTLNFLIVAIVAFIAFLAVFLWKFPLFIASNLVKFDAADQSETKLTESGFYTLGFALLGTYLLYWAVSDAVFWWYSIKSLQEVTQYTYELSAKDKASILATAVEFVMALFLVIGAGRISRFVYWLRHAKT